MASINPFGTKFEDITPTTTKGDVIVDDGTNAVRLPVGANDEVLTADSAQASGVKWAAAAGGAGIDFQEFLTSGTYTKPASASLVYGENIAGGAGGNNESASADAGGGGGGGYGTVVIDASLVGATETVTIGAGGAGGATGSDNFGAVGGDTLFGTHLTIGGGQVSTSLTNGGNAGGGEVSIGALSKAPGGYSSGAGGGVTGNIGVIGGDCVKGGGGGGGVDGPNNSPGAGGTSRDGGDGGAGNSTASTKGGNGVVPGGAGGGSALNGGGGDGAAGRVRVWTTTG
jgi:hypothetical protein